MDYSVAELIPHAEPMVLLDSIDRHDDHSLQASLRVRADSLFVSELGVPSWIGLEYLGQAIAALMGLKARGTGKPVTVGFLVSSRRYEPTKSFFPVGSQLTILVDSVTFNDTGLRVFECAIHCDGEPVVTANLNVYVPENVESFMQDGEQKQEAQA